MRAKSPLRARISCRLGKPGARLGTHSTAPAYTKRNHYAQSRQLRDPRADCFAPAAVPINSAGSATLLSDAGLPGCMHSLLILYPLCDHCSRPCKSSFSNRLSRRSFGASVFRFGISQLKGSGD